MANYITNDTDLTAVANAIRTKGGTSASLVYPSGYVSAINAIPTGGGSLDYTLTIMADGDPYEIIACLDGDVVKEPNSPSLSGLSFAGWYSDSTFTTALTWPLTITADTTVYAKMVSTVVIGFTGLTNSSGILTWTDDVAGMSDYTVTASSNLVTITSPLDNVWPYNAIERTTDSNGNVFVKFPKVWMKWVEDSNGNIDGVKFSNGQQDSSYFVPDAYLDPSNTINYLDYFYMGAYEASGSSSKMYSKSGQTPLVSITRAQARTAARAYGTISNNYNGYHQLDLNGLTLYNFLAMLFFRRANIQTVWGGRTGESGTGKTWSSAATTGATDSISGLNGWDTDTCCVKMLGVENPYGNVNKWVDGIYFSSSTIYTHRNPNQYADSTTGATSMGFSRPTSSNYISKLRHGTSDTTKSGVYTYEASGSASTYVGDYCYYGSSGVVLYSGGGWGSASLAGLWCLYGYDASDGSYTNLGARLSLRPL